MDATSTAEADSWCFRTERDHAREVGTKYKEVRARKPRRYSDDELAQAYQLYREEEVRGAIPRYWEDVQEGEALPVMFKGPMTVTGFPPTSAGTTTKSSPPEYAATAIVSSALVT